MRVQFSNKLAVYRNKESQRFTLEGGCI